MNVITIEDLTLQVNRTDHPIYNRVFKKVKIIIEGSYEEMRFIPHIALSVKIGQSFCIERTAYFDINGKTPSKQYAPIGMIIENHERKYFMCIYHPVEVLKVLDLNRAEKSDEIFNTDLYAKYKIFQATPDKYKADIFTLEDISEFQTLDSVCCITLTKILEEYVKNNIQQEVEVIENEN